MSKNNIENFDIKDYCTPPVPKYGYMNIKVHYFILVSLNEEADEKMWGYDIYDKENGGIDKDMLCLQFHEDTYRYMEPYIFDILNRKLDIIIDAYEEEYIDTPEMVEEAIKTMELILRNTDDKAVIDFGKILLEMLQIAKENNTIVGFLF